MGGGVVKEEEHLNFQETGSRTGVLGRSGGGRIVEGQGREKNHFESLGGGEQGRWEVTCFAQTSNRHSPVRPENKFCLHQYSTCYD